MVKAIVLQPLEKVTHARHYLKAQRTGAASFDREMVHKVFRKWYRSNDDKLAVILRDSPDITIGIALSIGSPTHGRNNRIVPRRIRDTSAHPMGTLRNLQRRHSDLFPFLYWIVDPVFLEKRRIRVLHCK